MAPFPFIKVFTLALKTLSKPVAKTLKSRAVSTETGLLRSLCVTAGQGSHRANKVVELLVAGQEFKKMAKLKPLDELKALNSGGDVIAESFVFLVACGALGIEYVKSAEKDKIKAAKAKAADEAHEAAQDARFEALEAAIQGLRRDVDAQAADKEEAAAAFVRGASEAGLARAHSDATLAKAGVGVPPPPPPRRTSWWGGDR